jgi:hypothetical protein
MIEFDIVIKFNIIVKVCIESKVNSRAIILAANVAVKEGIINKVDFVFGHLLQRQWGDQRCSNQLSHCNKEESQSH